MKEKVLIVEDEQSIAELLGEYFEKAGFMIRIAEDGVDAIKGFHDFAPHMVVLDRMLPGISGDQVCEEIRKISQVPILMLTAKSDETSRIEGFELGVDDYVTKPFSAREVIFRAQALMKRSYPEGPSQGYDDSYLTIDVERMAVYVQGEDCHLTSNEYELLHALYMNRSRPLSRGQLVELVFGYAYEAYDRNIDTYVKNIRHKIEVNPKAPEYIVTKYGVGYFFGKKD